MGQSEQEYCQWSFGKDQLTPEGRAGRGMPSERLSSPAHMLCRHVPFPLTIQVLPYKQILVGNVSWCRTSQSCVSFRVAMRPLAWASPVLLYPVCCGGRAWTGPHLAVPPSNSLTLLPRNTPNIFPKVYFWPPQGCICLATAAGLAGGCFWLWPRPLAAYSRSMRNSSPNTSRPRRLTA